MKKLPLLTLERLRQSRHAVLVESLSESYDYRRLRRFNAPGTLIIIQRCAAKAMRKSWLRSKAASGEVSLFDWTLFPFAERMRGDDDAYRHIESIYAAFVTKGRVPLKALTRLYGHDDVGLTFKKELLLRLTDYYAGFHAWRNLSTAHADVTWLPASTTVAMHRWLERVGAEKRVVYPGSWEGGESFRLKVALARRKFVELARPLSVGVWALVNARKVASVEPREVQLAIRLYKESWGLKGEGTHEIDWLLDGQRLSAANSVFVAETDIAQELRDELARRGYTLCALDYKNAFRSMSPGFVWRRVILGGLQYGFALLWQSLRAPAWFIKTAAHGWMDYLRWHNFLEHWRPRHYFTYNDLTYNHVFRNILLQQHGCQCWFFDHSNSKPQIYEMGREVSCRDAVRAFRRFDTEIHWGKTHIDLARSQGSVSKNFVAYGPLWTSHVKYQERLGSAVKQKWPSFQGKTLAAFSTTYSSSGTNGKQAHFRFLQALEHILDDAAFKDWRIIFKPKYPYYDEGESVDSQDEVVRLWRRLIARDRFLVMDKEFAASGVIYFADVTVSMAFASTTVEALLADKPGLYYDGVNAYPYSYFARFPDMVASNEGTLKHLIKQWAGLSPDEVKAYVDRHMRPEYAGHLDKDPVEIIRDALTV